MPESRLERTRAAYRPKPKQGLTLKVVASYDIPYPVGRYFPNEEQRQHIALAKLAAGDPYSVRILNP